MTLLINPLWNIAIPILIIALFEAVLLFYLFRSARKFNKKKKYDNKFPRAYYSKEVDRLLTIDADDLDEYERSLS